MPPLFVRMLQSDAALDKGVGQHYSGALSVYTAAAVGQAVFSFPGNTPGESSSWGD